MSISMMYQFENKLFSLPAKFFDFLVLPPPPKKNTCSALMEIY